MTLPSLFLAHGAPDLPLSSTPAHGFTESVGQRYPAAKAILVISAHWEAQVPTIGTAAAPETVYDFGGFDERLYSLTYPARTSAAVVGMVAQALTAADIAYAEDAARGYDHGVWIPLLLAFPKADLPVVQLSLRRGASAAENYALGQALAPLRDQGVLIIGSGSTVHNLRALTREGSTPPDWARAFDDWIVAGVQQGDVAGLVQFPAAPATARMAHPTPEHLMPFYVAFGAGGGRGAVIHRSFSWGSIGMTSFAFDGQTRVAA
jgi:4,5-DOPA dioxygenase extradiol